MKLSLFFRKINKTNKTISKLNKKQRENIQSNKIRNKKWHIGNLENHKSILKNLYFTKLENLKEMYIFQDIYHLQKLNQCQVRPIIPSEI